MPPKRKKAKARLTAETSGGEGAATTAAGQASATAAAAAAAAAHPSLTPHGIERLRQLALQRPAAARAYHQALGVGGVAPGHAAAVGGAAAAAVAVAEVQPVTLQIINIHRYFVDQRFWSLIGVPFPSLPTANTLPQQAAAGIAVAARAAGGGILGTGMVEENGGMQQALALAGGGAAGGSMEGGGAAALLPVSSAAATPAFPFDSFSDLNVAYDMVLSDGSQQVKAVLSPLLYLQLELGGLLPRGVIEVSEAGMRYDETQIQAAPIIVIKKVNIIQEQYRDIILSDPSAPLSYPSWFAATGQLARPLIGGPRAYYLSLFNDDTITFDTNSFPQQSEAERILEAQKRLLGPAATGRLAQGMQDAVLQEPAVISRGDVVTIQQLIEAGMGYPHGDKYLVGRVFAKSRIHSFGRKTAVSRSDVARAPFNFELLIGDASGLQIKLVLWNTLVAAYFDRIMVGHIVAIRGFRLKQARSDAAYELALNPYNPIGTIRLIEDPSEVEDSVAEGVPPLLMTLTPIQEVKTMADGSIFDLVGVVTYAGPMLREYSQPKQQFFHYRWLLLVDPSCNHALSIKLYTNSHQTAIEEIVMSDVIYLSNLTVNSTSPAALDSKPDTRSLVASSTSYTQLLDGPAIAKLAHPYLQHVLQWSQQVDHAELQAYPSLFRWSHDFDHYAALWTSTITPLHSIPLILSSLRYQQVRSVLVQAFIADIIIQPAGMLAIRQGRMDKEGYDRAIQLLYPQTEETKMAEEGKAAERVTAAGATTVSAEGESGKAVEPGAAPVSSPPSPSAAAAAAAPLRRSRRAHVVAERETTDSVPMRVTRSRARGRAGSEERAPTETEGTQRRDRGTARRGRSASVDASEKPISTSRSRRKGDKVVKTIIRKRKAVSPAAARATVAPAPSPPPPPPTRLPPPVPSSPSVLATVILRDLNGEIEVHVELDDPILPHAAFERASGTVSATCQTPQDAPRIVLGLSELLPSSAFTPDEWTTMLQKASGMGEGADAEEATPAITSDPVVEAAHRSIRRLYSTLLHTLSPMRLLVTLMLTRRAYTQVRASMTTVFMAQK